MSYTKQNFRDGSVLTANHLNTIEDGIVANEALLNDFSEQISTTTVPKLSELDIENSNLREYYIADGEVLNTTETSIQLEEGQYIIVQAKARSDSGYTSSDWSYLDSEGNPIAPPDPIPLVPWEGAIPTPIVTITDNIATWEANENAESYNYRIGTVVQPYSTSYPYFAKRERVYVQDSDGDVYTRYALSWDGRPIESPNAGRYGNPKYHMSSIMQRLPYGFPKVPNYSRADMLAMQEKYGITDTDMQKLTAPVAYVDETLELANTEAHNYADNIKTELETKIGDSANAINYTETDSLLILDDISPLESKIAVHSAEGGTSVRVSGSNFAYEDTVTVKGSTSWCSSHMTIYPPKNRKYVLSCDFENITGLKVGIAIKPDNASKDWWKELTTTEASGSLSLEVEGGDYTNTKGVALRFYSNSTASAVESECIFKNIVFRLADMEVEAGTKGIKPTVYTTDTETGNIVIPMPDVDKVLIYNLDDKELSATYARDINKHFTTIEDIAKLPIDNINPNKLYNLVTATLIHNRHTVDNSTCYIVDELPEVGEVATDVEQSFIKAYYNSSDKTLYGYLDETLAYAFSQLTGYDITAGWYTAATLFPLAGWSYAGVIDDIGEDPNDSTIRLLLEKKIYVYANKWIELTNSIVDKKLPTADDNGHFAYTVQRRDGVDAYELHLISHSINEAYKDGELMYPYQIPLRQNGIIKAAAPVEDLDVTNKGYVDNLVSSISNVDLTEVNQEIEELNNEITETKTALETCTNTVAQKAQVQIITWEDGD